MCSCKNLIGSCRCVCIKAIPSEASVGRIIPVIKCKAVKLIICCCCHITVIINLSDGYQIFWKNCRWCWLRITIRGDKSNYQLKKEIFLIIFYSALNFKYQCKPSDAVSWSSCKLILESVIDNIL